MYKSLQISDDHIQLRLHEIEAKMHTFCSGQGKQRNKKLKQSHHQKRDYKFDGVQGLGLLKTALRQKESSRKTCLFDVL